MTQAEYDKLIRPNSIAELKTMMFRMHPDSFVARPNFMNGVKSEKQMLDYITRGEIDGFVTITGGVECVMDAAGDHFGYAMQRNRVDPAELGEGFDLLCRQNVRDRWPGLEDDVFEEKVKEYKSQKCNQDITMTRRNFQNTITISMRYLKWLIKERGLAHFSLLHVYAYR